ncbi:DUF397 domain-containing protein [Streptomyces diastaticus]
MSPDELVWSKSTHSSGGDGGCVEVAMDGAVVCARDSKWEAGPPAVALPGCLGRVRRPYRCRGLTRPAALSCPCLAVSGQPARPPSSVPAGSTRTSFLLTNSRIPRWPSSRP